MVAHPQPFSRKREKGVLLNSRGVTKSQASSSVIFCFDISPSGFGMMEHGTAKQHEYDISTPQILNTTPFFGFQLGVSRAK
jgi:hypothetical protein